MTVLCDFQTIIGDGGGNGITVHLWRFEGEVHSEILSIQADA